MQAEFYSTAELFHFPPFKAAMLLHCLVRDFTFTHAMRLCGLVFESVPGFFPDFAYALSSCCSSDDVRGACFALAESLQNTPGAYDIVKAARAIAAGE